MAETNEPTDPSDAEDERQFEDEESGDLAFGTADFHNVVQKHVLNAVYDTLVETKLDWALVAPFLDTARELCRADFQEAGQIRLHAVKAEDDRLVEAEEAFLGISVADRDDGREWLSETYWLSDLAIAEEDPEQVRAIVHALERSIVRINGWLAERDGPGPTE